MKQQKATDACIDALRRRHPNLKPKPVVGTLSKPPPEFPVFAGLEDDDPQRSGAGSAPTQEGPAPEGVTPKVCPYTSLVVEVVVRKVVPCTPRLLHSPL